MNKIKSHYAGIEFDDVANGEGVGAVFFTQYCPHHCPGCQNPQTWSQDGGLEFTDDVLELLLQYFEKVPFARRLTISGGDPMANLELTEYVASEFKKKYPKKQLWIYTGFSMEYLLKKSEYRSILSITDVIVDGKFEIAKRNITIPFRGSTNQRIIDVQASIANEEIVYWR